MAGIIQGNGTKADLLVSTNIAVGAIYKVTDTEGFGEWLIKPGAPPYGSITNFAEVCTGINNAYAEKIDGQFANSDSSHLSFVPPYANIIYRSIADGEGFISTDTGSWISFAVGT